MRYVNDQVYFVLSDSMAYTSNMFLMPTILNIPKTTLGSTEQINYQFAGIQTNFQLRNTSEPFL
jgi:hypothetical protein